MFPITFVNVIISASEKRLKTLAKVYFFPSPSDPLISTVYSTRLLKYLFFKDSSILWKIKQHYKDIIKNILCRK
jgi:hypothetical protein